jgi:hypothetical protein
MMQPHGHPKFSENQDKLEARNNRAFSGNSRAKWGGDPCAFCGCGCKHGSPTVGMFYGREQPWKTVEDAAADREADMYMPMGSGCLKKLKKQVPNLWTQEVTL